MRRPLIAAAPAYGAGITIAYLKNCSMELIILLLTSTLVLLIWSYLYKQRNSLIFMVSFVMCFFLAGGLLWSFQNMQFQNDAKQLERNMDITGKIINVQKKSHDYYRIVLSHVKDTDRNILFHFKIMVQLYGQQDNLEKQQGKYVYMEVESEMPEPRRNPKAFDYRQYLKTQCIFAVAETESVKILSEKNSLFHQITNEIRSRFSMRLSQFMEPDFSGLVTAMLFGDKSGLDEEVYEDFQRNGTAHILAVSGLHMGILYGCLCLLFPRKKGTLFYCFVLLFLFIYVSLANFSPSVVRASVMIGIHLCAKILHQRYDMISSAAFTFLLMLVCNPMELFHAGFQLSFLAIMSLAIIVPGLQNTKWKLLKNNTVAVTIAIQAGMTPYSAYLFNYISFSSIISNVPIIFLAGILIPLGVLLMILSFLPALFFAPVAAVLQVGCKILVGINSFTYNEGNFSFDVISPHTTVLLLYYLPLFFLFSEKGRILIVRRNWKQICAGLLVIVLSSVMASSWIKNDFSRAELIFADVGQGDCLLIRTGEGKNYLIDGGGKYGVDVGKKVLKPLLLKNGIKTIDIAFVTHLHLDHYDGIKSLAAEGLVDKVALYEGNKVISSKIMEETGLKEKDLLYLYQGQQVKLGAETVIDVLYPERRTDLEYEDIITNEEDENASSLIFKVNHRGVNVLMTGDIDREAEELLVRTYGKQLNAQILKVAHHGSKYSSGDEFLQAVNPDIAVIQVGKNNFGHPSEAIVEKCLEKGIMVYRNDKNGAIGFVFHSGDGTAVKTMLD